MTIGNVSERDVLNVFMSSKRYKCSNTFLICKFIYRLLSIKILTLDNINNENPTTPPYSFEAKHRNTQKIEHIIVAKSKMFNIIFIVFNIIFIVFLFRFLLLSNNRQ